MAHAFLRLPAVKARTGLSRSTIYLRVAQGTFPKPISLGVRAVGWLDSAVDAWVSERIQAAQDGSAGADHGR
jgi:prophage regulatory protein